jgi:hypothetical protein
MNEKMRGLEEYRAKIEIGEINRPKPSHNLITRAEKNPNSLAMAINAFCFHCMGGTANALPDPGWKELIGTCTAPACPLFAHRPYRDGSVNGTGDDDSDEI